MKQLELYFAEAERVEERQHPENLECTVQTEAPAQRTYHIPGRYEDPRITYGLVRRWIMDFHEMNGMKLPRGFYQRNKRQLVGMFNGMLRTYGIRLEDLARGLGRE